LRPPTFLSMSGIAPDSIAVKVGAKS
jgi:hypothetical protein